MTEDNNMIYKYRKWDKFTIEMLVNNELFFADPSLFNDPFDTKCYEMFAQGSPHEWEEHAKKLYNLFKYDSKKAAECHDNTMSLGKLCNWNTETNKEIEKSMTKSVKLFYKLFIFSASKTKTENLLWGHYADSHKGICLGFGPTVKHTDHKKLGSEEQIEYSPITKLHALSFHDVIYDNISDSNPNFIKINMLQLLFNLKHSKNIICGKHANWAYEQETRSFLRPDNISNFKNKAVMQNGKEIGVNIKFARETLKEIIFGLECSESTRKDVIKILQNSGYILESISFKEIKKKEMRYELYTEDIDISKY